MDIKIDFTDKEITPWGGISLMHQLMKKMSITDVLQRLNMPQQGSNRGYSPEQLILHFWMAFGVEQVVLDIWKLLVRMK
jgi:hypothetical protein